MQEDNMIEKIQAPKESQSNEALCNTKLSFNGNIVFDTVPGCYQEYDSESMKCYECTYRLQCARQVSRDD
jgi:hypothetical protein